MSYVAGFLLIMYGISLVLLLKKGLKSGLSPDTHFVLINAKNTNSIEKTIKNAISKYPKYDLYVINCVDNEMRQALECMKKDFPHIHIIEKSNQEK